MVDVTPELNVQEYTIMSRFYPEDTYIDAEQISELSARESLQLTDSSLVYATRVFSNGTIQPTIEIFENGTEIQYVNVIYKASFEAGLMVLNQRIIIIEAPIGINDISLTVSYPKNNAIKPN